jgi:hypothetical protein
MREKLAPFAAAEMIEELSKREPRCSSAGNH